MSRTPSPVTPKMIEAGAAAWQAHNGFSRPGVLTAIYLAMHAARSNQEATPDADKIALVKSRVRDRLHRHVSSGTLRTEILIYDKDVETLLKCSDPETIRMAYKTGYQEGIADGDGIFDRQACEEGWQQYAEQLPERLTGKPVQEATRTPTDEQIEAGVAAFNQTETLSVRRLLEVGYTVMRSMEATRTVGDADDATR